MGRPSGALRRGGATAHYDSEGARAIRRLPVISREKQLVGIVALGDLAKRAKHSEEVRAALKKISMPPSDR